MVNSVKQGDIAQLARAPALQAGCQGFESPYLHKGIRNEVPAERM